MASRLTFAAIVLFTATPAAAQQAATQVSEASNLTLFALGVAGVLLGRSLSMRSKDDD